MRSSRKVECLRDLYPGQELHVIGSGPSLAHLSPDAVGEGPVVTINHAIRVVERLALPNPVYSMQKDQAFDACMAPTLAHVHESAKAGDFGDILFDCEADFGIPNETPSIVVCVYLGRLMGCRHIQFHCCDSFFGGLASYDGFNAVVDHRAAHYFQHPAMVKAAAKAINMTWSAQRRVQ